MATNVFDQFDQQAANPFDQFDASITTKPEKTGMLRAAADIPVQVGRGVAVGVKALSDVFGADNPVSRAASGVEDFLGGLLSAQAKNDQAEIARIMKEAQDKGVGDQVTAAVKAFATAPVDMLSQALGTAVPVIAGGLAGSVARLGAMGVGAIGTGVGAAMGAGTVKGQIYDAVKQELLANKVPEAEAEKRAQEAQAYGGKNLDQILMGAGIGAAEAAFGAERILTGLLRKGAVKPSTLPAKYRIPTAAGMEAVPEMAQAAQEQVAQNIALQREGYDVPTMRGVVGQATLEGLAGAGLGAITGAVERTEAAKPETLVPAAPQKAEAPPPKEAVTGETGIAKEEESVSQLTPSEGRELELQQRLYRSQQPKVEDLLGEVQGQIQTSPPTTPADIARIRDDHETAVINSLLEQDRKMQGVADMARANMERMSQLESMEAATADADRRVREGRLMARVQSLIDENIPFASTAIADINRKFEMIGEAPLDDSERARVQNIMTMAQGFTDFVKLPSLPVREQDRFAENQAMEALIKERKPRGQVSPQPVRAETPAPSPVVGQAPVSGRVEEGAAIRPEVSPEPGIAEDRQRAKPVEPQKAEAEAPKPVTGEAGIVRPEEEVAVPEPVVAEAAKPEGVAPEAEAVPQAEIAKGKESTLWRYNEVTGMWNPQRKVTQETQNQWLNVFQSDDPTASFVVSKKQPTKKPQGVGRVSVETPPTGEARPEGRVQPEGEGRAAVSDEEAGVAAQPLTPVLSDYQRQLKEYWDNTATPAIRNYLNAINSFGIERLEKHKIKPVGVSAREWLESFVRKQSTWDNGRKTGQTGIQTLSIKDLWPTTDGSGERLRKAMLNAVKALKNAPGTNSDLLDQAFQEERKSLRAAPAQQVSDFEQTLRTALNKLGLKDVGLKLINGMTEEGSYAQKLIQIAADSANPIRTLRHEAIHALRELGFFMPQQWQSLSKMAKDKWIDQYLKQRNVDGKPLKAGEESRYDAYMREYNGDMEKITEEAVADAFADFDATKPPAGLMQALLTRLRNLFQAIKSALTKVESPEKIFGKVERGELAAGAPEKGKEAKSLRDRATANFLRWFGDSKVVDEKGEPLVVYHWTDSDFTEFDMSRSGEGAHFGTKQAASDRARGMDTIGYEIEEEDGQYFVVADLGPKADEWQGPFATKKDAISFRAQQPKKMEPMAVYLSINNPIRLPDLGTWSVWDIVRELPKGTLSESDRAAIMDANDRYAKLRETLLNKGIDGVVYRNEVEDKGSDSYIAFIPTQIKSAIGNNGEYSLTDADIRKSLRKEEPKPTPTTAGQSVLDTINQLGMGVQPPEPGKVEKIKTTLKNIGENPSLTVQEAKKKFGEWMDWFETKTFSADAKFEADVRRGLKEDMAGMEALIGTMLSVSQSGAVHADAVATQAVLNGRAEFDPETQKWVAVEDKNNITELSRQLEAIADKYGLTKEEAQRVAHTYFVAKNYNGILERNKKTQAQIDNLKEEGKKEEADDLKDTLIFVTPDQEALVAPGLELINQIPELGKMVETWNNIRQNFVKTLVDSYLWSPEYATAMLDNIDYVPFYREEQVQEEEGPQQMIRGLQVKSKEHKLKGSASPVNDVFDNMARWMQYAMNRAIRNHKALQMVDVATEMKVGDRMMAKKVSEPKRGMNVARVWRGGKQEFYDMADPLYVGAFQSLGAVSIPSIKFFTDISNILRKTVVMYPLFSIGQLTQDSVAAIFASGLKPQHAFKIPFLAVQEFIKTMKGWSTTHDELVRYGIVGVRDFNATVARQDAEITAGIKAPRGAWGKVNYILERIAMSADNAVRQATYIAATDAGLSKAESLEKAFEIINFRRRGSSKLLNLMGQTVPFFYAYLSAQRVAYKTLTGVGISPTERKAALETLAQTTAAVMALSFLYAMANGDDEEYKKTPATVRDRSLIIPGSGGVRIPLRPDFFLFPKVIAEHTYQLITDEGYSDGAKMRKSMADLFANAALSPNPVPQLIKPTLEAGINYSFFEGKPIIGFFEQNKEAGRQFNESTSEFAKMLGQFGASPQMVDHLVRGYFGSVGGLALWGTNFFIEGEPGVPRPELTAHDMLTTMPGVGAFKQKSSENALKVDFYELRDAIAKAKNTYDDMKVRSPEGLEAFLQDEKNLARLAMDKQVTKIGDHLSKIRRAIQQVAAAPVERMSASEKQERIKELRDIEMELLKAVDVKAMRAQAKL